jgi:hypothetical protein
MDTDRRLMMDIDHQLADLQTGLRERTALMLATATIHGARRIARQERCRMAIGKRC